MIEVTGLFVYPIKACSGTALDLAEVGPRGIRGDREWLVVDAPTGDFLTQRECPALALLRPTLRPGGLGIVGPTGDALDVPVRRDGPKRPVRVWDDRCDAIDQGDEPAACFSQYLNRACRLVRLADDFIRPVNPTYAISPRDQVGFADGYPFLLISEESLTDLNARLVEPLPMNRFRPNIVISGAGQSFVEDQLQSFRIGPVVFHAVKPCGRCVVTTTDQATAEHGTEPLTTLATFRKVGSKVLFGQNLVHDNEGTLRRGDEVEVREWRAPAHR